MNMQKKQSLLLTLLSALLYGFFILLVFPFVFIRINVMFDLPVASFPLSKALGLLLMMVGSAAWMYCIGLFHIIGKGTPVPINSPKQLVATGMYRFTRNPMYMSVIVVFLGSFLFFGYVALLFYALLLWLFFHLFITLYEEPTLEKKFGKVYREYCQRVPRWI